MNEASSPLRCLWPTSHTIRRRHLRTAQRSMGRLRIYVYGYVPSGWRSGFCSRSGFTLDHTWNIYSDQSLLCVKSGHNFPSQHVFILCPWLYLTCFWTSCEKYDHVFGLLTTSDLCSCRGQRSASMNLLAWKVFLWTLKRILYQADHVLEDKFVTTPSGRRYHVPAQEMNLCSLCHAVAKCSQCRMCRTCCDRMDPGSFSLFTLYIINGLTVEPNCPSGTDKSIPNLKMYCAHYLLSLF